MKKLLFAALLLLGINIVFVSCEKGESDKVNTNNIEGKWWIPQQKADYVFSGKPVSSFTASNDFEYAEVFQYKAYLENGSCTLTDIQDGDTFTFAYTLIDNDLYIGQGIFQSYRLKIANATQKEGGVDLQPSSLAESSSEHIINEVEKNGTYESEFTFNNESNVSTFKKKVLDTFNEIDIYGLTMVAFNGFSISSSLPIPPFWYINSKGERVSCMYNTWENGDFDFWYDTYRIYFKAE